MPENYRVALADDQAFIRKGLIMILNQDQAFTVIGEADNGMALLGLLNRGVVPDVLILDLSMPILSGVETIRRIREMALTFKILVLTMHKEPELFCRTCLSGASGYMLKDGMANELLPALHTLLEDKIYLSPLMLNELPDTCRMKSVAEQGLPFSSAKHCKDYLTNPQGE